MASGGNQSPPPPPAAAASSEEEEEDGDAADRAQPAGSPSHQIQQRFEELCSRLNMDEAARAEAWSSYRSMSESYTLEGNDLHWLACALYVACRKSVPTVSKGTAEGNYVSLTRILRCSEQSLIEFFNKMKKWEDMANLPPHFRERTERLERNFTVSAVIFKKYEPIFQDIFKYPQEEQPRQQRGRKQRRQPCTTSEIFHFCWVLFIYAKGLSEDCHPKDSKASSDPPCVIEKLCSLHDGLVLEAKGIKEHFWKPYIRKLFEKKLLKGKEENLTGFLEPGNFGESFKAVNKAYEEYVLAAGNLDERVFLGEDAEEEVGTLSRCLSAASGTESAERTQMRDILQQHLDKVMPPQNLERTDEIYIAGSPLTPRRVGEVRADAGGLGRSITSPTTLYDRYSSPTVSTTRRRLFENDSPSEGSTSGRIPPQPLVNAVPVQNVPGETVSVTPVPGQTLVTMATATVTANNGQTVTIPVQGIANENGGITFFPVQVNVGGQAQAVAGSIQPLSAQALAGSLSSQQVTGTTLQVPGPVAIQQISPGGQQQNPGQPLTSSSIRPRKTSSLALFFRKVYYLAGVRLRDLCIKLDISDELRKKIWTCFEFSIIQCTELMMDRHLDQLLMCAIYVMAKVTKEDRSFQNIMRCYRTQPQARSQVYRSVLIKGKRRNSGSSESRSHQNSPTELNTDRASRDSSPVMRSNSTLPVPQPSSAPPTPTRLTGASSDVEEEERGDLIQFYNNIYRKQIQAFAMKYSQANAQTDTPPLSPYPFVRTGSPRRVQLSQSHPIYISPHNNEAMPSPREKIFYYFSNSPSKRLREINSMIRTGETPTKKRGILLDDGSESPAKRICPENHSALLRRLQDVANDRGSQ